jgi:transcriptional regulator with XRE-family HTH domain
MKIMEFREWMNKKYIEWRGDSRGTISEFAEYIGVRQPVMSKWMNKGGTMPDASSLAKIASKFGVEVYDVLGLPRPMDSMTSQEKYRELLSILDELPEDRREKVIKYARAVLMENEASSTDRKTKPRPGTSTA